MTQREKQLLRRLESIFSNFTANELKRFLLPWRKNLTVADIRDLQTYLESLHTDRVSKRGRKSSHASSSDRPAFDDSREVHLIEETHKSLESSPRDFTRWLDVIGSMNDPAPKSKLQEPHDNFASQRDRIPNVRERATPKKKI